MAEALRDPALTILLSTFDGARFLPAQLESFRTQSFTNWTLYWRDDGSADDSVAIMRAFAASEPPGRVMESPGSGPHLSASASFLTLLAEAEGADLVAFADQDDVWLDDKLRHAVDRIVQSSGPALYCARQYLVDEQLEGARLSVVRDCIPGFPACLTQNVANGNTLVMNRAAARIVASMGQPKGTVHDWWSYITVSACGGEIIFDDRPAVLYRLHKNNLIGSARPLPARAVAALKRGPAIFMTMMRHHADGLAAHQARLSPPARRDLACIRAAMRGGMRARIKALRCPGFRRRTMLENILFAYWFMTDSLPPAKFAPIEAARVETR